MLQTYHPMGEGAKNGVDSCVNKGDKIGIIVYGDMWSRVMERYVITSLRRAVVIKNSGKR